jgi:uncharacterized membrane protein YphA (DoxX/SURF4 family)
MIAVSRLLQLFGSSLLGHGRAYAHCREASRAPQHGVGLPDSRGHYLDLVSAILGCALLLIGLVLRVAAQKGGRS